MIQTSKKDSYKDLLLQLRPEISISMIILYLEFAQSAGAVENTDCFSAEE